MSGVGRIIGVLAIVVVSLIGCTDSDQDLENAQATITASDFSSDVKIISSDEFEGRAPSSPGEEKTVNFLNNEFQKTGLEPGNGSSFFQDVPLVAITASPDAKLRIAGKGKTVSFSYGVDYMAWTKRVVGRSSIAKSDMVFVGYGTVAPEYDWNDYAGIDVHGKTVVMLVNDPGFATQDSLLFHGNAMTYYGRWTYKFEEAARQGAVGALIIHETEPASYPWAVVTGSWSGKQFALVSDDNNMSRCAIEGWLTLETAQKLFKKAGLDLDKLKESAEKPGFKAVPFGLKASLTLENDIEHSNSRNVLAKMVGSERPEEVIIYTAHWDHFGKAPDMEGDNIFNGAFDNATGTASLLELAEAFMSLKQRPPRSIVFLAVTAEEQGLLGSSYYATHPVFPTNKTVAAINIDGLNVFGKMNDITIIGYGNSELDDYVTAAARHQNRTVRPDPEPQKGSFYRSDHFNFAKRGIPALYTDNGIDDVDHGPEWTLEQMAKYTEERYHKPADEFDPNWDLTGAVDDMRLLFEVGYRLANETGFPNWREGNEFKALRDSDMRSGGGVGSHQ